MGRQFFGEIQVHKTMIHPNVVRYVECFEDSINIYMILELCPNKTLMDMLRKRKRFTEPEVRYYLVQLLGAANPKSPILMFIFSSRGAVQQREGGGGSQFRGGSLGSRCYHVGSS